MIKDRSYYLSIAEELDENKPFPDDARKFFFGISNLNENKNNLINDYLEQVKEYSFLNDYEDINEYEKNELINAHNIVNNYENDECESVDSE